MKKFLSKKFLSLLLICSLVLSSNITAYASQSNEYEDIVNQYNKIYNVSLEYIAVAPNTDVNEYREFIAKIAKEERATIDYIDSLKANECSESSMLLSNLAQASGMSLLSTVIRTNTNTKTASSASYLNADAYKVTCTYECYTNTNASPVYTVGNPTAVSVDVSGPFTVSRSFSMSSWDYSLYDSYRTLGITAKGTVYESFLLSGNYNSVGNVTVFASFGWIQ